MNPEDIVVLPELKAYIDPLTPEEHDALERSILAEGCRDALVLWGNILVDGHNRFGICHKHGLPFQTVQNTRFQNMEDVHLWMIDQHLGRRSVSEFQRGVLALRKREIIAERRAAAAAAVVAAKGNTADLHSLQALHEELEAAAGERDRFFAINERFHMRLLELADNRWRSQMVADLRKVMKLNRHNSLLKQGRIEDSLQEHRRLMQALCTHDAEATRQAMQDHFHQGLEAAT